MNQKEWDKLPKAYQKALEAAAAEAHVHMTAEYDARNPPALARLLQSGVKLRRFPKDILAAAHKAAFDFYQEEAGRNPQFRKILENWLQFRKQQQTWFGIAEANPAADL